MDIGIGSHSTTIYDCLLIDKCWSFLPEKNVFLLYSNDRLPMTLMKEGIIELTQIPESYELNEKHQIQVDCEKTGKPYINKEDKRILNKINILLITWCLRRAVQSFHYLTVQSLPANTISVFCSRG